MLTVLLLTVSLMGYAETSHANEDIAFYKAYRTAKKQPKTFYKLKSNANQNTTAVADQTIAAVNTKTKPNARSELILVNLNEATIETLKTLPYIGEKRAEAIIEFREQLPQEKFTSIDQLCEIKGISTKLLERIRVHLVL